MENMLCVLFFERGRKIVSGGGGMPDVDVFSVYLKPGKISVITRCLKCIFSILTIWWAERKNSLCPAHFVQIFGHCCVVPFFCFWCIPWIGTGYLANE